MFRLIVLLFQLFHLKLKLICEFMKPEHSMIYILLTMLMSDVGFLFSDYTSQPYYELCNYLCFRTHFFLHEVIERETSFPKF